MPISLLPPEVLARVFHFLVLEDPPCSPERDRGWMRATQVCRFWRQVAQDDSSLWATISWKLNPTNTELISEMLYRSRDAPLDIDLDFGVNFDIYGPQCREVLLMFPPHLPRIRKLRLYNLSVSHFDIIQSIYGREASALEHFELGFYGTFPVIFQDLGDTKLFKGQAPRLRTLFLSHVLIPWSLIPRGQLTHLKIVVFNEFFTADPLLGGGLNQFIDLLINCPGLETLALERCLPSKLAQLSHGQTIHLPRLSRLWLDGSSSRITNLMKMLNLPSSTTLHLHCMFENTLTHDDHLLLPIVSAKLRSPAPVEFQELSVTVTFYRKFSLEVTTSTTLPSSRSHQPQVFESDMDGDVEFVLKFDGLRLDRYPDLLGEVCEMLPISNLEFLSISSFHISDSVNWVRLFERCRKVTTMQVIGGGTNSFVRALTDERRDNRDNTPAQPARSSASPKDAPIFPKLTSLSLERQDFAEGQHPSGILFDVVERGLRQRRVSYEAPLEMLRIDNCSISAQRAEALQKLVQKFHWDQNEGFDLYDDVDDSDRYGLDCEEPMAL
jgi:hypothetical protein